MMVLAEQCGADPAAVAELMRSLGAAPGHMQRAHRTAWEVGADGADTDPDSLHGSLEEREEAVFAAVADMHVALAEPLADDDLRIGREIFAEMQLELMTAEDPPEPRFLISGPTGPPLWLEGEEIGRFAEPLFMFEAHADLSDRPWPPDLDDLRKRHYAQWSAVSVERTMVDLPELYDLDVWETAVGVLDGARPPEGWQGAWHRHMADYMQAAQLALTEQTLEMTEPDWLLSEPDLGFLGACHIRIARIHVLWRRWDQLFREGDPSPQKGAHALLAAWSEMEAASAFYADDVAVGWMGGEFEKPEPLGAT